MIASSLSGFHARLDTICAGAPSPLCISVCSHSCTYFSVTFFFFLNLGKDHINLILDFAGWVLDANPEEGLKIFTEDIAEVEQLPRPKVLDYLLRTHKDLVIPYLVTVYMVFLS